MLSPRSVMQEPHCNGHPHFALSPTSNVCGWVIAGRWLGPQNCRISRAALKSPTIVNHWMIESFHVFDGMYEKERPLSAVVIEQMIGKTGANTARSIILYDLDLGLDLDLDLHLDLDLDLDREFG